MSTAGIAARTGAETTAPVVDDDAPSRPIALVDLLDRLLGTGVVLSGDITISLSGIDLVEIHLHALITSVRVEAARTP
ncbi:gas vesicle protein [Isoptericola cucumis]|uniref:gas vesicle protein n=1 Tax=Isoptericola cucumis TaxID=1776856 RepID=UPI003208EC0C